MNSRESFIDRYGDIAMQIAAETGVRPEVILSQTALETGWGKHAPGNNMFGIKGPGQVLSTREDYGRGLQRDRSSFRAYATPEDSFRGYGNLKLNGRQLSDIVDPDMTMRQQVSAIKGAGYATDRNYVGKVSNLANSIAAMPSFRDARSTFQADTIQGMVGIPQTPAPFDLAAYGPPIPDTLSAAAPDYSDITAGLYDAPKAVGPFDFGPNPAATRPDYGITPQPAGYWGSGLTDLGVPSSMTTPETFGPSIPTAPGMGGYSPPGIAAKATGEAVYPDMSDAVLGHMALDTYSPNFNGMAGALTHEIRSPALPEVPSIAPIDAPGAYSAWGEDSPKERNGRSAASGFGSLPAVDFNGIAQAMNTYLGDVRAPSAASAVSAPAYASAHSARSAVSPKAVTTNETFGPAIPASPLLGSWLSDLFSPSPQPPQVASSTRANVAQQPGLFGGWSLPSFGDFWGGLTSMPEGSYANGGPGGYGGGEAYGPSSGPYGGGDARMDGGWGGLGDSDTYR